MKMKRNIWIELLTKVLGGDEARAGASPYIIVMLNNTIKRLNVGKLYLGIPMSFSSNLLILVMTLSYKWSYKSSTA